MTTTTILIVEDSEPMARIVEIVCHKMGFDTKVAYDGQAALAALDTVSCACVDGSYPDRDQFHDALVKSQKPFIIYSGDTKRKGCGEVAFVLKPSLVELRIALTSLFNSLAV